MTAGASPWRQVAARVARQEACGVGYQWLDLEVPAGFPSPQPGQFVQLLMGPTASSTLLPRPMSVAGVRTSATRRILSFLYAPVGTGTQALALLEPGREVQTLGPLGRGFPLERPGTPVLIAGGRGVAPLLFATDVLARAAGARNGNGRSRHSDSADRCEFIFGARTATDLVGLDAAREKVARIGGRLHLCTDDGSRGTRGTVLDALEQVIDRIPGRPVLHACGPHGMLAAIAEWALERELPAYLATESVMACGTGVCRGCPLPRSPRGRAGFSPSTPSLFGNAEYAMCCTEGPVFEARELDWEHVP